MSKRPREEVSEEDEEFKIRSAIECTGDDLVCPISFELPIDPVIAEDGHVYERSALRAWFEREAGHGDFRARSPMTGKPMPTRVIPAIQIRQMLERMVRSGAFHGDKAAAWEKRIAEMDEVEEWRRQGILARWPG